MAEEKKTVEATIRNIRRATRKKYNAEEKVRIGLEGLRGESTISELCRKEGIHPNLYFKWSKKFMEARKQRLIGYTQCQADSQEVIGDAERDRAAEAGGGGAALEEELV